MERSRFNIELFDDALTDGGRFIYNTFTDSRCFLRSESSKALDKVANGELLSLEERELSNQLAELGILVPKDVDEDRELEYWFQKIKFDSSVLQVTVLPTMDCNLRCTYCFESDVLKPTSMKPETTLQIVQWISQKLEDARPRTLLLTFFGGEPLLNWSSIEFLCKSISQETDRQGISLELQLISNGVLLDKTKVNFLTTFGPTLIKVTLDGHRSHHDAKRPYLDGSGTFQTIISNLLPILGTVDLVIGGNYDEYNLISIPELLDYLRSLGFNETNCSFAFKPIMASPNGDSFCSPCTYSDTKVEELLWTVLETERRGLKAERRIALQPCEAMREWAFTIDPFGQLYKCPAMVGRAEGVVGHIREKELNYTNTLFMTADHWKKCRGCSLRPICNGGCGFSAYIKHGDYQKIACERRYIEKVSLELIKEECLEDFSLLDGAP